MTPVEPAHGAATHVGLVRDHNEDAFLVRPPVFAVADGMGGHHAGDVASRIVVEELERLDAAGLDSRAAAERVGAALRACQARIHAYAAEHDPTGDTQWYSGTTLVAALLVVDGGSPRWVVANLGDSRAYRYAEGALHQVSVDHSVVQELIDAGRLRPEDAAGHPARSVVTRALGGPDLPEPDWFVLDLAEAPRLLLCSDGINAMVDAEGIAEVLGRYADPQDAAEALVAAALEAGGVDNATAVVVDCAGMGR